MAQQYISVAKEMKQLVLQTGYSEHTFNASFRETSKYHGRVRGRSGFLAACRQHDIERKTWMHFFEGTPHADAFPGIDPRCSQSSYSAAGNPHKAIQRRNDLGMTGAKDKDAKRSQPDRQGEDVKRYWNPTIMGRYPGPSRKDPSATCYNFFD